MVSRILLWLFVINLGLVLGAGLYEARIEFPQWLIYSGQGAYRWSAETARDANTGVRFWIYVTTIPLTLVTLANVIAAWRSQGRIRSWWLAAALVALVDRIFTFSYFIPTMANLMSDATLAQAQAVAIATRWGQLNYLRHAIVLTAWLLALQAFSYFRTSQSLPSLLGQSRDRSV